MLNTLRKAAGTWVAKILFLLLILSFGAWGVGDFLRPQTSTTVATVGKSEISQAEYNREFRREMERLRSRFGGALTQEVALQLGLGSQVLSSLVERKLLSLEAYDRGIRISDDLVRQQILSEPAFQEGGGFDRQRFAQALQMNDLTEESFVAMLRDDLTRQLVSGAIAAGVTAPPALADLLYRFRQEERVAELLFLPNEAAGTVPQPSEAEIAAFYEQNKERYAAPEYRSVTALVLRPADLVERTDVAETRIREAYENRSSEFRVPETRTVAQLLFSDEAAARSASERLRGGASLDTVATEAAGVQRTDLGEVRKGDLFPQQVENAVFALPAPGATEPVQSPLGWHVLQVGKITPETLRSFEEVRDQIRREIANESAVDEIIRLSNQVEDALAGGATLEEVAQRVGVPALKIASVDRNGKDAAGKPVDGLPRAPSFLTVAFDTAQGELSRLTETPDGGYFLVRPDQVTPRAPRPLDTVRDEVIAASHLVEARKLAAAEAQKIAEQLRTGAAIAEVGRSRKLEPRTSPTLTRQSNLPAEHLPAALVEKLFLASVGEVAVEASPDGVTIARLTEIRPVVPAPSDERVAELRTDLTRRMTADLQAQYAAALQSRYGVTIDQDALQRAL